MSAHVLIIEDRSGDTATEAFGLYNHREEAVKARMQWAVEKGFNARILKEEGNADSLENHSWIAQVVPLKPPVINLYCSLCRASVVPVDNQGDLVCPVHTRYVL